MARPHPALVAVISTALVLTGCGQTAAGGAPTPTTSHSSSSQAPTSPTAATVTPPRVPEQLDFTAQTIDGKQFSGASLAGKPAVLWFWAPWCPKCQAEAPTIADAARAAGDV